MEVGRLHLVVEIADTSLEHDLKRKAGRYARWGIVDHWVVDVYGRQTHVHRDPVDGAYGRPSPVPFTQALTSLRLPELRLTVADLPRLSRFDVTSAV